MMDGGGGGTGGTTTTGTGGTTAPPMEIMCGDLTCTAPGLDLAGIDLGAILGGDAGFMLPPGIDLGSIPGISDMLPSPEVCCTEDNACGVTGPMVGLTACVAQGQVGEPSDTCPEQMTTVMGFDLPLAGCCREDNLCGVDLSVVGVGCLELTEAAALDPAGQGDASVEEMPCTYGGGDGGS